MKPYNLNQLFKNKGMNAPGKLKVYSILKNHGYDVSLSYINPFVFYTNAPHDFIIKLVEELKLITMDKNHVSSINTEVNNTIKAMLLNYPARFMPNPESDWGPKKAGEKIDKN